MQLAILLTVNSVRKRLKEKNIILFDGKLMKMDPPLVELVFQNCLIAQYVKIVLLMKNVLVLSR